MVFWKNFIVLGMGQQLAFISQYTKGRDYDSIIEWYFECPAEISSMAIVPGIDGDNEKYLVIGALDKKIRWYILDKNEDNSNTLRKVHSVKAHSSRVAKLLVLDDRKLYSGGGSSDASIKLWKSFDDCEINPESNKRECGLLMEHEGHTDIITCLFKLGKDYLISGSGKQDGSLRVWDVNTTKSIQARISPHTAISGMFVINDYVFLTGGNAGDRKLCVWTTKSCNCSVNATKCVIQ